MDYTHIYIALILAFSFLSGILLKRMVNNWLFVRKNNKSYNEKVKKVEEMKASGEVHDWIEMPISPVEKAHVCRKTGWCPRLDGFVVLRDVKYFEEAEKTKKEFEEFEKEEFNKLAEYYSIGLHDIYEIRDKVYTVKQNFYVKKMEKSIAELVSKKEATEREAEEMRKIIKELEGQDGKQS